MNHDIYPSTTSGEATGPPLSPRSTSCPLLLGLWASHPLPSAENTPFLPTGPKHLLCLPLGPAHSRCTLQGFCVNKTYQFAPTPSCGHTGHKSQPALCIHLSLSSLQAFAPVVPSCPEGSGCANHLHCPGGRWDWWQSCLDNSGGR